MITLFLVDISLTNTRLTKSAIDFGGRRYITTSKLGARIARPANVGTVDRPFHRVSRDLVEYKTESVSPTGVKCSYALTIIGHLSRFAVLVALPDKKEQTIAKALVERVDWYIRTARYTPFRSRPGVRKKVVKQLQDVFGYKNTKTTPYRPQGNSVLERIHSTLHAMLSMYSNTAQNNRAEVLPFLQLAQIRLLAR